MMYSKSHRYVFIHIPKCAGTSIRQSLRGIDGPSRPKRVWNRITGRQNEQPIVGMPGLHTHSDALQVREALGMEVYHDNFSFAFVRNPWDRMLSLYNNYWQASLDRAEGRRLPKGLTPEQERENAERVKALGFRRWLLAEELQTEKYGESLTRRSQLEWLRDDAGQLITSFIGRVETIADDFSQIQQCLQVNIELAHANRSQHRHYRDEYCDETRDFVATYFRDDIDMFGYSF